MKVILMGYLSQVFENGIVIAGLIFYRNLPRLVSRSLHQQDSSSRFPTREYERRSMLARFQQIYCVQQMFRGFIAAPSAGNVDHIRLASSRVSNLASGLVLHGSKPEPFMSLWVRSGH